MTRDNDRIATLAFYDNGQMQSLELLVENRAVTVTPSFTIRIIQRRQHEVFTDIPLRHLEERMRRKNYHIQNTSYHTAPAPDIRTKNLLPFPTPSDSAHISPWCACTICFAI